MTQKSDDLRLKEMNKELEKIRVQVSTDEMKARHWKAQYEIAYYHLQFDKILPDYQALLQKNRAEQERLFNELQKNIEENSEIKVEEVNSN